MLQGTLDLLILKTLAVGPAHGHTIAHVIERRSDDVLQVEHGSLYPALHRLEDRGWIASFWGTSENNRRARYYRLTPAGRKQLAEQTSRWDELVQRHRRRAAARLGVAHVLAAASSAASNGTKSAPASCESYLEMETEENLAARALPGGRARTRPGASSASPCASARRSTR